MRSEENLYYSGAPGGNKAKEGVEILLSLDLVKKIIKYKTISSRIIVVHLELEEKK